eukprot:GHVP01051849.1.p1 GENE.GHVP01051849.1~~GHVP01051849.1.p1  ORF type:complete len:1688 (-),score=283.00 GHVP01051849.1:450-4892(-)
MDMFKYFYNLTLDGEGEKTERFFSTAREKCNEIFCLAIFALNGDIKELSDTASADFRRLFCEKNRNLDFFREMYDERKVDFLENLLIIKEDKAQFLAAISILYEIGESENIQKHKITEKYLDLVFGLSESGYIDLRSWVLMKIEQDGYKSIYKCLNYARGESAKNFYSKDTLETVNEVTREVLEDMDRRNTKEEDSNTETWQQENEVFLCANKEAMSIYQRIVDHKLAIKDFINIIIVRLKNDPTSTNDLLFNIFGIIAEKTRMIEQIKDTEIKTMGALVGDMFISELIVEQYSDGYFNCIIDMVENGRLKEQQYANVVVRKIVKDIQNGSYLKNIIMERNLVSSGGKEKVKESSIDNYSQKGRRNIFGVVLTEAQEEKMREQESRKGDLIERVLEQKDMPTTEKAMKLKDLIEEDDYDWFVKHVIERNVSIDSEKPKLVDLFYKIGRENLICKAIDMTYCLLQQFFIREIDEKKKVRGLGDWIGLLTIERDIPIFENKLSLKRLLLEHHNIGQTAIIIPLSCHILAHANKGTVFTLNNPWIVVIIQILAEIYDTEGLKMNIKFDIEVLCQTLGLKLANVERSKFFEKQKAKTQKADLRGFITSLYFSDSLSEFDSQDVKKLCRVVFEYTLKDIAPRLIENVGNTVENTLKEVVIPEISKERGGGEMKKVVMLIGRNMFQKLLRVINRKTFESALSSTFYSFAKLCGFSSLFSAKTILRLIGHNIQNLCNFVENAGQTVMIARIQDILRRAGNKNLDKPILKSIYKYQEGITDEPFDNNTDGGAIIPRLSEDDYCSAGEFCSSISKKYKNSTISSSGIATIPKICAKFRSLMNDFEVAISDLKERRDMQEYTESTSFQPMLREIFSLISVHLQKKEIILHLAHIILSEVIQNDKTHLLILLPPILDQSEVALYEVSLWLASIEDIKTIRIELLESLVVLGCLDLMEYDRRMSEYILARKESVEDIEQIVKQLLQFITSDDRNISVYDFFYTIETLNEIQEDYPSIKSLLNKLKNSAGKKTDKKDIRRNMIAHLVRERARLGEEEKYPAIEKICRNLHKAGFFNDEKEYQEFVIFSLNVGMEILHKQINCAKIVSLCGLKAANSLFLESCDYIKNHKDTISQATAVKIVTCVLAESLLDEIDKRYSSANIYSLLLMGFIHTNFSNNKTTSEEITEMYNVLKEIPPKILPSFSAIWVEISLHPIVLDRLILSECENFEDKAATLLEMAIDFITKGISSTMPIYIAVQRSIVTTLRDHPQFLTKYSSRFVCVIPKKCLQMRNFVLSAFPKDMELPDPFDKSLVISLIEGRSMSPPAPRSARVREDRLSDILEEIKKNNSESYEDYNITIFRLADAVIKKIGRDIKKEVFFKTFLTIFKKNSKKQNYLLISAVLNNVRYPNTHTFLFAEFIFWTFLNTQDDNIKEIILLGLLERLIANRPHPWGILFVFFRLIRESKYGIEKADFIQKKDEIRDLFQNITKTYC